MFSWERTAYSAGLPYNTTLWKLTSTSASPRCSAATEPHLFGVMPSFHALGLSGPVDRAFSFAVWDPDDRALLLMDEWWNFDQHQVDAPQSKLESGRRRRARMMTTPIVEPLSRFKSSRELLSAIHDAFKAHQRLWEDLGIVHGDVGPNICIVREGGTMRGVLLDFDTQGLVV